MPRSGSATEAGGADRQGLFGTTSAPSWSTGCEREGDGGRKQPLSFSSGQPAYGNTNRIPIVLRRRPHHRIYWRHRRERCRHELAKGADLLVTEVISVEDVKEARIRMPLQAMSQPSSVNIFGTWSRSISRRSRSVSWPHVPGEDRDPLALDAASDSDDYAPGRRVKKHFSGQCSSPRT